MEFLNKLLKYQAFPVLLILFISLWFRIPGIRYGMPYFYDEDEGHHFNRTMNMVKTGDFNPHYFLKPSLHFYLRIPAVSLGFLWEVKKNRAHELKEIITKNKFGLADYAFTASHPGIVKWARAVSLFFGLLLVILGFNIVNNITGDRMAGALAAFAIAVSPALIQNSTIVGVDTITAFFSLLVVHEAVRLTNGIKLVDTKTVAWISLLAGLTVSTKYNSFPIAAVPLFIAVAYSPGQKRIINLIAGLLLIAVGFLAGTPYSLKEFPLFLNHIAYEIWHYGVAGHAGHEAQPGIAQALHYLSWLAGYAAGYLGLILAAAGAVLLLKKNKMQAVMLLIYPVLFFCYMCSQKANFERNMISVICFIFCFAAIAFSCIKDFIRKQDHLTVTTAAFLILSAQLVSGAFVYRKFVAANTDSRNEAEAFIRSQLLSGKKIAVSGELQFFPYLYKQPGVVVFSEKEALPAKDAPGAEYNMVVSRKDLGLKIVRQFAGTSEAQRIVNNPLINVSAID